MLHTPPLGPLLEQYAAGSVLACEPVDEGLLNRGYRLRTTRGRYFLKHHFDPETADPAAIARQGPPSASPAWAFPSPRR